MSEVDKSLAEILNTDYLPAVKEESKSVTIHEPSESVNNPDADYSRSNYYNLIEKGNEALEGILEVAKESQHPRAYEVAANLIKNLSDLNKDLLEVQKRKKDLVVEKSSGVNVDKAVFVGSTAELMKLLKTNKA